MKGMEWTLEKEEEPEKMMFMGEMKARKGEVAEKRGVHKRDESQKRRDS
ncbi:hypothetical protein [Niallia circulans]